MKGRPLAGRRRNLKTKASYFLKNPMAKKRKAAKRKAKHMAYYCVRCGFESNKRIRHHGKMMEKC